MENKRGGFTIFIFSFVMIKGMIKSVVSTSPFMALGLWAAVRKFSGDDGDADCFNNIYIYCLFVIKSFVFVRALGVDCFIANFIT